MPRPPNPDLGAVILVRVIPRASRDELIGWREGALVIRLAAPPVEGAANRACLKFLGELLDVAPSRLSLEAGYKDVQQRYHAMRGFDQRWQNGFDCQGLWVEVNVEKELNLGSKRDIEAMGLERFVLLCKQRVLHFAAMMTEQSIRLGQWMRWD